MSKHQKSVRRLLAQPKDFGWDELTSLMSGFGYDLKTTGGSGRKFVRPNGVFAIHEPHPYKLLKSYQIRAIITFLRKQGDIT